MGMATRVALRGCEKSKLLVTRGAKGGRHCILHERGVDRVHQPFRML